MEKAPIVKNKYFILLLNLDKFPFCIARKDGKIIVRTSSLFALKLKRKRETNKIKVDILFGFFNDQFKPLITPINSAAKILS